MSTISTQTRIIMSILNTVKDTHDYTCLGINGDRDYIYLSVKDTHDYTCLSINGDRDYIYLSVKDAHDYTC
jgi:hypothetical protein